MTNDEKIDFIFETIKKQDEEIKDLQNRLKDSRNKRGKSQYQKLKDKAWKKCSEYVRTKECIETTGDNLSGVCCTCGKLYSYKDLQAGHFIAGRNNSILFELSGIHAQCYRCNVILSGNHEQYEKYMLAKYGQEEIDRLKLLSNQREKLTEDYLKDLITFFETERERMLNESN